MTDLIIIFVLVIILGASLSYMKKEKKKGVACIGCPDAGSCAKRKQGAGCGSTDSEI